MIKEFIYDFTLISYLAKWKMELNITSLIRSQNLRSKRSWKNNLHLPFTQLYLTIGGGVPIAVCDWGQLNRLTFLQAIHQLKVPRHEIGQSELFTPFKDILLGHSKGTVCTQKFFIWTPLLLFFGTQSYASAYWVCASTQFFCKLGQNN